MNNQEVIEIEAFRKIYTRHEDFSLTLQIVCRSCGRELLYKNYKATNHREEEMILDEILVSYCLNKDIKSTLVGLGIIKLKQLFSQQGVETNPIESRIHEHFKAQIKAQIEEMQDAREDARMDRESDLSLMRKIKAARTDEERFLIRKVFGIL